MILDHQEFNAYSTDAFDANIAIIGNFASRFFDPIDIFLLTKCQRPLPGISSKIFR